MSEQFPRPWRAKVYKGSKPWSKDLPDESGEWSVDCQHPDYPDDPKYRLNVATTGFGPEARAAAEYIVEAVNSLPYDSEDPDGWLGDKLSRLSRVELVQRVADAEAAIMNAQDIIPVTSRGWWALDDYGDGSMDAIKQVVAACLSRHDPDLTSSSKALQVAHGLVDDLFPRKLYGR